MEDQLNALLSTRDFEAYVEKENIPRDAMIEERDLMEKLLSPAELELFVSFNVINVSIRDY